MAVVSSGNRRPVAFWSTEDVLVTSIPLDKTTATGVPVIRLVVPVAAGDQLRIDAVSRIVQPNTHSSGKVYWVGIGARLEVYDVAGGGGPKRIGPYFGDNTERKRHYCPVRIPATYTVPDGWPDDHRLAVQLIIDAHSTIAEPADVVTLTGPPASYSHMIIEKWV